MLAFGTLLATALLQGPATPPPELERFVDDVIAWIDERAGADLDRVRGAFNAGMDEALSKSQVSVVLRPLRDSGDVQVELLESKESGDGLSTWIYSLAQDHSLWTTTIVLDSERKVTGWWLRQAPRHRARKELIGELAALSGDWGLCVVRLDETGGELERIELGSGRKLLPLGSIFKLYVLAELARKIAAGEIALDWKLTIREDQKSLPSGQLQDLPDGSTVTVEDAARDMIRISDNTATDLLLALVGRDALEAHLAEYASSAAERNQPFLSTLELFTLKGLGTEHYKSVFERDSLNSAALRWAEGTPRERRQWLAGALEALAYLPSAERRKRIATAYGFNSLGAKHHTEIEWLARPADIVGLVAAAHRGTLVSPEASRIFLRFYAAGTPIYALAGVAEQGFKGGSETAVLALSSRVVLADGRVAIGCIARAGFNVFDPGLANDTQAVLTEWMRNLLEGEPASRANAAEAAPAGK